VRVKRRSPKSPRARRSTIAVEWIFKARRFP
jgi:hypothetical protein